MAVRPLKSDARSDGGLQHCRHLRQRWAYITQCQTIEVTLFGFVSHEVYSIGSRAVVTVNLHAGHGGGSIDV